MNELKNIIPQLKAAKKNYEAAQARMSGVASAREGMKNLLFNYFDELLQAAIDNEALREEVEALDVALKEADAEIQQLSRKKKPKPPADDEAVVPEKAEE